MRKIKKNSKLFIIIFFVFTLLTILYLFNTYSGFSVGAPRANGRRGTSSPRRPRSPPSSGGREQALRMSGDASAQIGSGRSTEWAALARTLNGITATGLNQSVQIGPGINPELTTREILARARQEVAVANQESGAAAAAAAAARLRRPRLDPPADEILTLARQEARAGSAANLHAGALPGAIRTGTMNDALAQNARFVDGLREQQRQDQDAQESLRQANVVQRVDVVHPTSILVSRLASRCVPGGSCFDALLQRVGLIHRVDPVELMDPIMAEPAVEAVSVRLPHTVADRGMDSQAIPFPRHRPSTGSE
jgi:hypothetical protein